jgi:hypothetical protein
MIPRVGAILRLGRVPVPHTNEAVYALDTTGRRWVAKREADLGCEALIGYAAELERRGLVPPDPRILAPGFPPPGLRDLALACADRVAALDPTGLATDAAEACDLAREPAVDVVPRVLVAGCAAARALTTRYLDLVESRP